MSSNPVKPAGFTARALGPLPPAGDTFDDNPIVLPVPFANAGMLLVTYTQPNDSGTAQAFLRISVGQTNVLANMSFMTIEDASAPSIITGIGLATSIYPTIKAFPQITGSFTFSLDLSLVSYVAFAFAEHNRNVQIGTLGATLLLNNEN